MATYEVDLSAWLTIEVDNEEEAFAIAHGAIDKIRNLIPEFDGEIVEIEEVED